ncbi:MAG: EF-P beta-lysylation protein EpmB [Gammaproteobacteria bacterium]|nr:MAG: EF-P beta-lysylation protein EpmB [Gammaproteobacteria bacterium]
MQHSTKPFTPTGKITVVTDTASLTPPSDSVWKKELSNAVTSVAELLEKLDLSHRLDTTNLRPDFPCLATENYINKMQVGDFNDPLLQQVLPLDAEVHSPKQQKGIFDPVGDVNAIASQGLLHKYHGRALLITTGACAIHCRYCFRQHYPYQQASISNKTLADTLHYLNKHHEIEEIILSGGDPLVLDNEKLSHLINNLESIEHLRTLRIHTRLPVVLPSRINDGLLTLLKSSRFQIVMVIHANHANELHELEKNKLGRLQQAGVLLLNQSVLLKGINDTTDRLVNLSKRLFACHTLPYYLHLLDPVKGAMHFEVTKQKALLLKHEIEEKLPGYLVPRLVQEIAGNQSKTAIFRI